MFKLIFNFVSWSLVVFVLLTTSCNKSNSGNSFEGEIVYKVKMTDHVSGLSAQQMEAMLGPQHSYFISKGRYKSVTNGSIQMHQTYLGGDTLYNEIIGTPEIMWHDVRKYDDEVVSSHIEEDVEEINGILCSVLHLETKKGSMQYFYNKEYPLNPDHFKNHNNAFWNYCVQKTNALPLKWITDSKDFFIELTFTSIEERMIDDNSFVVPNYPRSKLE